MVVRPCVLYRVLPPRARRAAASLLSGSTKSGVKNVTKTLVVTKRFEVRVLPRKATILRIELDCSEEARDRLR